MTPAILLWRRYAIAVVDTTLQILMKKLKLRLVRDRMAGAYVLTRRLWLSIGFHASWNYTQSAIFSSIVSGNEAAQGLIRSTVNGPDFLTGGKFGVESSVRREAVSIGFEVLGGIRKVAPM